MFSFSNLFLNFSSRLAREGALHAKPSCLVVLEQDTDAFSVVDATNGL